MKVPQEKALPYTAVLVVCAIVAGAIGGTILGTIGGRPAVGMGMPTGQLSIETPSAKQGQTRTAAKFYQLAGDSAKAEALEKKNEAQNEKAEAKRQGEFKKEQKSLEKEFGF